MADHEQPRDVHQSDTDRADQRDDDGPALLPDADAGQPEAAKYSRDEKSHGRQDYGP